MITSQSARTGPFTVTGLPIVIPVSFPFQLATDLLVLDIGPSGSLYDPYVTLTLNSDYVVAGGGYDSQNNMVNGSITVQSGGSGNVQLNDQIVIIRNAPINQLTSLLATGPLTPMLIEQAIDKQATLSQDLNIAIGRSIQIPASENLSMLLPQANDRSSKLVGFDSSGNLLLYSANSLGGNAVGVTSVALNAPAAFTVTGSPITTAGTLTLSYSGTAIPVTAGGTGRTSWAVNDIPYANTTTTWSNIGYGTNSVLMSGVGSPFWGQTLPGAVQQNITALSTSGNFQVRSLGVGAAPPNTNVGTLSSQVILPYNDNTVGYICGAPTYRWSKMYVGSGGIFIGGDGTNPDGAVMYTTGTAPNEVLHLGPNASGSGTVSIEAATTVNGLLAATGGIRAMANTTPAAVGNIGQYLSNEAPASATALSNNTFVNVFGNAVSAITLSPGDWDVGGTAYILPNAATYTNVAACLVQTNGGSLPNYAVTGLTLAATTSNQQIAMPLPVYRVSVNANTALYFNISFRFSAGTATGGGYAWARRSANAG